MIGFFLRALRICSEDFLEEELRHIFQVFLNLQYPKGLLLQLRDKAKKIKNEAEQRKQQRKEERRQSTRTISIPNSKHTEMISSALRKNGIRICVTSGKKIGDIIKKKKTQGNTNSIVYKIPCSGPCRKSYIGETGRGLSVRISEHRRDVKNNSEFSSIVKHIYKCHYLPDWENTSILEKNKSKSIRKALEAAHINTDSSAHNLKPGFFRWATVAARLAIEHEH